jgi:long-subunit fatty acid transport protein
MNDIKIAAGLKFKSIHFAMDAEIKEVREKQNEVDVILTPSNGHAWVENAWNLQHVGWGFQKGEYYVPKKEISISVF